MGDSGLQQRQIPSSQFVRILRTRRLQLTEGRDVTCFYQQGLSPEMFNTFNVSLNTFSCCSNTTSLHETQRTSSYVKNKGGGNHITHWHMANIDLHKLLSEICLDKIPHHHAV